MKCLSVCQPFADLILSGRKRIEIRSWNTRFRGEFLVHAPQKVRVQDARRLHMENGITGAILGKAEITGVKSYQTAAEFRGDRTSHYSVQKFQGKLYGFVLENARPLHVPVPYKGQLGFFEAGLPRKSIKSEISDIIDEEYRYQWIGRH